MGNTYGNKMLRMRTIYRVLKQIKGGKNSADQRKFNLKKSIQTADVTAGVDADYESCINSLALGYGTPFGIIFSILHKDFGS